MPYLNQTAAVPGYGEQKGLGGNSHLNQADAKPSERQFQIEQEVENLDRELSFQSEQIAILGNRLTPIMSLEPPDVANASKEPGDPTCPMANMLRNVANGVRQNNAMLNSYLRKLEI